MLKRRRGKGKAFLERAHLAPTTPNKQWRLDFQFSDQFSKKSTFYPPQALGGLGLHSPPEPRLEGWLSKDMASLLLQSLCGSLCLTLWSQAPSVTT